MRDLLVIVAVATVVGLGALLVSPAAALALGTLAVVAGLVLRVRGDALRGGVVAGTGVALLLAAVVLLALVDRQQDDVIKLGPDSGLTPIR